MLIKTRDVVVFTWRAALAARHVPGPRSCSTMRCCRLKTIDSTGTAALDALLRRTCGRPPPPPPLRLFTAAANVNSRLAATAPRSAATAPTTPTLAERLMSRRSVPHLFTRSQLRAEGPLESQKSTQFETCPWRTPAMMRIAHASAWLATAAAPSVSPSMPSAPPLSVTANGAEAAAFAAEESDEEEDEEDEEEDEEEDGDALSSATAPSRSSTGSRMLTLPMLASDSRTPHGITEATPFVNVPCQR